MKINISLLLILIGGFCALPAQALVKVDTNDPEYSPISIAITNFASLDALGSKVSGVIARDLQNSDVFSQIPQSSFGKQITPPESVPRFEDWESIGSKALVMGRVVKEGRNRLRTEYRLWDIKGRRQISGKKFFAIPEDWRRIAHIISDEIHQSVTGEKGYFNTRILFVSEAIIAGVKKRSLCVIDQDGFNIRFLAPYSDQIIMSPRFSPNQQKIVYESYDNEGLLKVYLMNAMVEKEPKRVGNFRGIVFSPRFSPKGNRVVVSVQKEQAVDIYEVDVYSNEAKRLTNTLSVNVSASYSPDSSRIIFESDRGGNHQLYVMKSDGSGQQRISRDQEASYFDPSWSPKGDLVVFSKVSKGEFSIGIMNSDGSKERILVTDSHLQSPMWSPNGRFVMFLLKKAGDIGSKIYSIDLNGRNKRLINTPAYASGPQWLETLD
ncbi:MAG: Tol-Pal system protein TolB [Candidatus Liberibacter ctenarytainae]|uniref:Tol-Pal system protein TolB n=1 Tax=Candidatus Liberibacter ctenarytainae TaxID=2020335 RepID=A0A937AKQ4_9HYPH|nr:Tol-Pal system protein TolB [Candidatus Liberibacter ctenarytainae]